MFEATTIVPLSSRVINSNCIVLFLLGLFLLLRIRVEMLVSMCMHDVLMSSYIESDDNIVNLWICSHNYLFSTGCFIKQAVALRYEVHRHCSNAMLIWNSWWLFD